GLATEADVLLLDEPLSNLDAKLRQMLRLELKALLRSVGTTTIVVTHDQEEAVTLSEHVVIVNRGRIEQEGSPDEVYERPRSRFVAEFMGRTNWFSGRLIRSAGPRLWRFESDRQAAFLVVPDTGCDALPVEVAVRPERMSLQARRAGDVEDGLNRLGGRVEVGEYLGADLHHWVRLDSGDRVLVIEKNMGQALRPSETPVVVQFEPGGCIVLPLDASTAR